ncbi:hypothetical protein L3Y34_001779 [Caenorhabditis briggsae]|uniref:Uncharacterized protein n=1 Tax=Caenorhabditis briggsae TaxID=6238 RepID=A0AAE9IQP6_CAEBR|nr:hypothetical protein L3Y34_001779 [Caenorhabditis briggsae]
MQQQSRKSFGIIKRIVFQSTDEERDVFAYNEIRNRIHNSIDMIQQNMENTLRMCHGTVPSRIFRPLSNRRLQIEPIGDFDSLRQNVEN